MKLKTYLFTLFTITILALGVWLLILFNVDRNFADFVTKSAFFGSLFLWLMGIIAFIIFYLRVWISNREVVFGQLPISVRHACLISLAIVGLLIFKSIKIFTWWDSLMFVLVIVLIELFFRTRKVS